jgi:hypothetical protein
LAEYGYVYNVAAQSVPLEGATSFSSNGVLTTGIVHVPGTPGTTLVNAGVYKVTYSVSGTEPNQFALFADGVLIPGTVYGAGAGTQQNTGQVIFQSAAGAVITLRNHSSSAAIGLATLIGGTAESVNASILIEKLG